MVVAAFAGPSQREQQVRRRPRDAVQTNPEAAIGNDRDRRPVRLLRWHFSRELLIDQQPLPIVVLGDHTVVALHRDPGARERCNDNQRRPSHEQPGPPLAVPRRRDGINGG